MRAALSHADKSVPLYSMKLSLYFRLHVDCGDINFWGCLNLYARPVLHVHLVATNLPLVGYAD